MTMTMNKIIPLLLTFVSSISSFAVNEPLVTLDTESGSGALTYAIGETKENVTFGPKSGRFLMAFAVDGKLLPTGFKKDFAGKWVIQLALGNLKGSNPNDLAQFGAASLIVLQLPTEKTTVNIRIPDAREKKLKNTGYLLFSSPSTPADRSNEEKLKGTYFGSLGTAVLVPIGDKRKVAMQIEGKPVLFYEQKMKADINTEMTTPFNSVPSHLGGSVEFPVYWPASKAAETFAKNVVSSSFAAPGAEPAPEEKPAVPVKPLK